MARRDTASSRSRDQYELVGQATRIAIERAVALGLTKRRGQALVAVIWFLGTHSKLADRVYLDQLAAVAKIEGDADNRHLRRALRELASAGAIEYPRARGGVDGNGKGRPLWLGLPGAEQRRPLAAPVRDVKEGQWRPDQRAAGGPPTEKVPEKDPVVGDRQRLELLTPRLRDVDEHQDELHALVKPLGFAYPGQWRDFADALAADPAGFRELVGEVAGARKPVAALHAGVRNGAHLRSTPPATLTPAELRERWVRTAGWQFQLEDLVDELDHRGVDDEERERLLELAATIRAAAA